MKRSIILFATMLFFQTLLFSNRENRKVINLIITVDNEIIRFATMRFVIVDTINSKNDTIRAFYFPGHLSIEENDFNRLVENDNVSFYIRVCDAWTERHGSPCRTYHINFYERRLFFTPYTLLHIYTSNTKEFRRRFRDNDLDYTYEIFATGYALTRARKARTPIIRRILGR